MVGTVQFRIYCLCLVYQITHIKIYKTIVFFCSFICVWYLTVTYTEDVWDQCAQYAGGEDRTKWYIVGQNSIIRSCIVYTLHQMLLGWSNKGD